MSLNELSTPEQSRAQRYWAVLTHPQTVMCVISFEPGPTGLLGSVPAQGNPHKQGPSGAACPALATSCRPALNPLCKSQKSLLRTITVVLNFFLSIHHWYLLFKHFSLDTLRTYQLKWLCAPLLERLSFVSGGGTERRRSPVQQFCFSCRARAGWRLQPAPLPALRPRGPAAGAHGRGGVERRAPHEGAALGSAAGTAWREGTAPV